jgi:ABC-type microcin C transport system permease subunit YejE
MYYCCDKSNYICIVNYLIVLKKIFHKLLFVIPLLGLMLSYANIINTTVIDIDYENRYLQSNKNNLKELSFYHEIEENTDFSDIYFEESELEEDFEFDWVIFNVYSVNYTSSVTENHKLFKNNSFCLTQKSTSLYDLFCSWKHHLS